MKSYSLLFIIFSFTHWIYGQAILSRIDIAHKDLSGEQLKVAATAFKAMEADKFELMDSYLDKHLEKDDHKLITSLIQSYTINIDAYPPLVKQSEGNLSRKYSRAYYKSGKAKKVVFIANVSFKEAANKIHSVELIQINEKDDEDLFYTYINKIVCGNPPAGPPAIGNLIDFKTSTRKKLSKSFTYRKEDINKIQEIYPYKAYNLSITFKGIPKAFFDTTSIWELNIVSLTIKEMYEELGVLTPKIGDLKQLRKLGLNLQNTVVPSEIFDLKNLEELSLTGHSLVAIPKEIGKLKNLSKLVISGSFAEVPYEIGELKNLKILKLSSPNLKSIPESIGNLYDLSSLWISKAVHLEALPKEIGRIKNIKVLNFNEVEKLPKLEEPVNNISELYIYHAKDLSEIKNYLAGTRKLRLRFCSIATLPDISDYGNNLTEILIDDCSN